MSKRSMTYYVVTRERGENWDARLSMRQQEKWDEHAAFMNALVDDVLEAYQSCQRDPERVHLEEYLLRITRKSGHTCTLPKEEIAAFTLSLCFREQAFR